MKVPGLVMNHDFVVSERYLACILPPLVFNLERAKAGAAILDAIDMVAGAPMRLLIVEKADLTKHRWLELAPGFMFHFGNAWDAQGVLRFDYVHHDDALAWKDDLGAMMRGDCAAIRDTAAHSTHVSVDLARGRIRSSKFDDYVEFPRVDPRFVARRNASVWHAAKTPGVAAPVFGSIVRYDVDSGKRDVHRYAEAEIVEEHIVIPDPARTGEGAGWLVGCTYDTKLLRTTVNVLDALDLAAGPIARVALPYGIPPGFHGDFVRG
jgi:all-trans-8'-apo-beta-carotenal 15,15'-oxygenase